MFHKVTADPAQVPGSVASSIEVMCLRQGLQAGTVDYIVAPDAFRTDVFEIRSYRPGDGALLREATVSSYEHLRQFMPWATDSQTEEEAEHLARQFHGRYLLATDFVLAIFRPDGKELFGGCGYHLREGGLEARNAELGMWIRQSRAGQGLGTAALEALLAWGFTEWPWQRLSWRCDTNNTVSLHVAEKAGMRQEGVLKSHMLAPDGSRRDTACYALTRAEWTDSQVARS